jgi:hypothetical protein
MILALGLAVVFRHLGLVRVLKLALGFRDTYTKPFDCFFCMAFWCVSIGGSIELYTGTFTLTTLGISLIIIKALDTLCYHN